MLSDKDLDFLFDGKWGVENGVDVNHIISQLNELIGESNTILKDYEPKFTDAIDAQMANSAGIESVRGNWCKKVDGLLTKVFHGHQSSVQTNFDLTQGDGSISRYVEVWQSIKNRQNVLDSFRTDLQNLNKQ